jgi:hypothetical protein
LKEEVAMSEHTRVLVAYGIAAIGVLVSFATAVQPFYGSAYKLHGDLLIWGLVPYLVYIGVSGILHRATLVLPAILLLASDLALRAVHSGFPAWVQSAPGHAAILTLIVLPIGILVGKGMSQPLPEEEPEFLEAPSAEEAYEKETDEREGRKEG